jgi:protein-L-isoaspartate(D-aspartate) O-methyltransferase
MFSASLQPQLQLAETASREAMIEGQLRPNGVTDAALLARVAALPRQPFAPAGTDSAVLYLDQPLPLGYGRSLLPPRTSARLLQALELNAQSRLLVVAAGSGYEAAMAAPLVAHLTAAENNPTLLATLRQNLVNFTNAEILPFGPAQRLAVSQPFTNILVAAPFAVLPAALTELLAEGGKLAGVRVDESGLPTALVRTKHGTTWFEETLFETPAGVVHPALAAAEHFVF